jgi:hypothetical protein
MLFLLGLFCIPSPPTPRPDEEEDGGTEGLLLLPVDVVSIF